MFCGMDVDEQLNNQFLMDIDDDIEAYYWGLCPADILLQIFRYLDAKDLLACMSVNTIWRVNADYWGKKSLRWLHLVENGMQNKGLHFRQRSQLDFRMLYINCRMWYSVHKAQVTLKHVYNLKGVRNMHVYKDSLIVINEDSIKFFNINTGKIIKEICEPCLDYQETDYLVAKITQRQNKKHITLYSKHSDKSYEILGFKLYNIQHNKCYIMNIKNAIEYYECTPKNFELKRLGRYYSSPRLLGALYMYEDDKMYIYITRGDIYCHKYGELQITKLCTLEVPNPPVRFEIPTEFFVTVFDKGSVIYGVSSKGKENIIKKVDIDGNEHLVLLYSDLTCAVQCDDILLLGFKDGKVGIVILKNLRTTYDLTPAFQFYIQDVANIKEVEPIESLEVHEAEDGHHLFISTKSNLFQILISHPD